MLQQCSKCQQKYDDADCSTVCPHRLIMPSRELEQKKLGLTLIGKLVKFRADLRGADNEPCRVLSVSWDGMVTIERHVGQFAPHLFTVIE